jgi:gas vesicle protein GvpN
MGQPGWGATAAPAIRRTAWAGDTEHEGKMAPRATTAASRFASEPAMSAATLSAGGPATTEVEGNGVTVLQLRARANFVRAGMLDHLAERAETYLRSGIPVHFRGPAGSGKTTMALHLAEALGRPVVLLVGDDSFDTSRLVGEENGMRTRRVVDRYIHNVTKVESETAPVWLDRALTVACTEGCTLVYDEFNRAPPAANNVLLSVLEERLLVLPKAGRGESYLRVHPEFRAIFTSNPSDHVGIHMAQDALLDRMITLDVDCFDHETETAIVAARSGMLPEDVARIVDLVRDFRASGEYVQRPSLRAGVLVARLVAAQGAVVSADDPTFVQIVLDVLGSRMKPGPGGLPDPRRQQLLVKLIDHFCAPTPRLGAGARLARSAV